MTALSGYKQKKSTIKLNKEIIRNESDLKNLIGKNKNNIFTNILKSYKNFSVGFISKKEKGQKIKIKKEENGLILFYWWANR